MSRRRHWSRTDEQLRGDVAAMGLLAAVAEGRVIRASEGGFWAAYLLDGVQISPSALRRLARDDLVLTPMVGPPRLAERGRNLLGRNP